MLEFTGYRGDSDQINLTFDGVFFTQVVMICRVGGVDSIHHLFTCENNKKFFFFFFGVVNGQFS